MQHCFRADARRSAISFRDVPRHQFLAQDPRQQQFHWPLTALQIHVRCTRPMALANVFPQCLRVAAAKH